VNREHNVVTGKNREYQKFPWMTTMISPCLLFH